MRFAMFALGCTEAQSNETLRTRAYDLLQLVQQRLIFLDWRNAVAEAAAAEEAEEGSVGDEGQRHSRGKSSSVRKPRQGWTKAQMRELNARMCCACRIIAPRALMWRIMHIKLPAQPGSVIKPRRQRRVRHRTVWLAPIRVPGKPPKAAKAAPGAAAAEAMPEGSLVEKKAKLKAQRAAEAAQSRGKVVIQRLSGGASEEAQGDEALWAQPARGVRSVYVCRNPACVRASVKLKVRLQLRLQCCVCCCADDACRSQLLNKGLRCPIGTEIPEMLARATELETAADESRPADAPPPGVSPELWARIATRAPRVPGRPTEELRGPHDNWFAPPTGPRRT